MVAVLSMSKQEFSRLEVLLRVQSGGLRVIDAVAPINSAATEGVISTLRAGCHFYLAPTRRVGAGSKCHPLCPLEVYAT